MIVIQNAEGYKSHVFERSMGSTSYWDNKKHTLHHPFATEVQGSISFQLIH